MEEGEFRAEDLDKVLRSNERQFARVGELQQTLGELIGRGEDEHGLVYVEYGSAGLRELKLHPKAMRLSSAELADLIKLVMADAAADLQRKVTEAMDAVFGDQNPMRYVDDPEGMLADMRSAESAYNRVYEDAMGELDKIRDRMEM
ncbi:YbaB/EbfC family nucleoid-associated protein [Nonomuraea endophytica]|uniref:DNA-binding protein YbaB n=1 Tax=Nonomuraea endophytica TaxID=714136 RepID=A0A7W7ZWZ9_9ACTN|nr:YbaB/EbfC family nucleoid-associated protein [Nonomuraea endophytica]MBB5074871.1 DNA-binding protein YbaB [Nonomuraea endophytica]